MFKIFLIVILLMGAAFGIPSIRARVLPHLDPVLAKLGPVGEKISAPSKRWAARNEINILVRKLAEDYNEHKELPDALHFQSWIKLNTRGGKGGNDPWGHPYYIIHAGNNVTVGSQGPDRLRNTSDDIRVTIPIS